MLAKIIMKRAGKPPNNDRILIPSKPFVDSMIYVKPPITSPQIIFVMIEASWVELVFSFSDIALMAEILESAAVT